MASNLQSVLAFGVGFVSGWGARSLADSPQGVGVRLMEIAMKANKQLGHWAAAEGERIEDMLAEARSRVEPDIPVPNGAANGSGPKVRMVRGAA
jgi:hypothetical protein